MLDRAQDGFVYCGSPSHSIVDPKGEDYSRIEKTRDEGRFCKGAASVKLIQFFILLCSPFYLLAYPHVMENSGYIFDEYPPFYYPASIHFLVGVSAFGDSVEIEDGSVWKISPYDGCKILNWRSHDPLMITQNHRWLSSYNYRIVNQKTGAYLEANIFLGPLEHGQYTLYITEIDRVSGDLVLTNGLGEMTYWEIPSGDYAILQNWALRDAIIMGQNSGWNSNYESLLINVNMNNYARAKQS